MRLHKYTHEQLREAVRTSGSIRQALKKLDVAPYGGNYATFKKAVKHFEIDTSHFHGKLWNMGDHTGHLKRVRPAPLPLEEILVKDSDYQSYKLKNRLLKAGIKEHRCEMCNITEWLGKEAPLELDHVNGDRRDNRLLNLRVLCPNCHATTSTYRGKNRKRA